MTQAPATIFLVDDDDSVLRGLGRLLRAAGYATKPFSSPTKFLEQLSGDTPGCAVLDLRMPVMEGVEVVRRLRERDPRARVIVLTTYDTDEEISRALKAGA